MVLKNSVVIAKASSLSLMVLVMLTCVSWILFPLVDSTQDKVLLFAAWYPFDTSVESIYRYTYVLQSILLLTTAAMNAMMDMLTTNFYVVMVGQLEILKQDFKQMSDIVLSNLSDTSCEFPSGTVTADKKLASSQEGKASYPTSYSVSREEVQCHRCLGTTNTPEDTFCSEGNCLEKILNERVAKCTIRHKAILTFINDVKNVFQIGIVAQICASSIIICVTCFEMTLILRLAYSFFVLLKQVNVRNE
ncbi:odorant receptor Or1-like [Belonocnema kinseyi]|uniref:odorant receptor Or1-like n=1 Tax=Belonocnema kinseyi TaxID=2817044 RepID=UPI00143DFAEB|nr:odorant receptor Or1-like [Belonocnema kinseyi]